MTQSVVLTQPIRVGGSVLAAGTTQTLARDIAADLVARGFATPVGTPSWQQQPTTQVTAQTDSVSGGSTFIIGDLRNGIIKSDTPRQGALKVPRSALTRGLQTIWRVSSTELNIFSSASNDIWMRGFKTGVYTSSSSIGVASQFWRLLKLIKLLGAVAVPTANATPAGAGSFTAAARDLYPGPSNSGQVTASGVVFGSSTQNDAITWSVTVPASGVIKALLFNSSGAAQTYTVACGGQSKSGTLTQSPLASTILPQVITLTGCTTGAQTLSITKTGPGGLLYTAGQCIDVALNANSAVAASSMIYWFDPAEKYIDGNGANDFALNISGTFAGSYHGGHYGSTVFKLDGVVTDLLSGGPLYTGSVIDIVQDGAVSAITVGARTQLYSDGHTFDLGLKADALTMTEAHVLMSGSASDMTVVNEVATTADSTLHTISTSWHVDIATTTRSKALTAYIENLNVNGSAPTNLYSQYVNTGGAGYVKGYCTVPIPSLNSLGLRTVWTY
jgi:hypothetical protein